LSSLILSWLDNLSLIYLTMFFSRVPLYLFPKYMLPEELSTFITGLIFSRLEPRDEIFEQRPPAYKKSKVSKIKLICIFFLWFFNSWAISSADNPSFIKSAAFNTNRPEPVDRF